MTETSYSGQLLNQMIGGYWTTQAIYVAAELGIADLLSDRARTVEDLAKSTGSEAEALYRVLRALASIGIFAESAHRSFSLTPLAGQLRSDAPGSQRAFAIMMGAEFYDAWRQLICSVKTGRGGFRDAFGADFFEYMTRHPERHRIYDRAMNGVHGGETGPMLDAYDFSRFGSIVDVGGGNGAMLAAILQRHPDLQGVLFDMPEVAERARRGPIGSLPSARCRVEGGDFFSEVPAGADAYLLRHVIHDWQDDAAMVILRNCREAMNPNGRILVVEYVIPPGNGLSFGKWLDLMMLLVGGRERTEVEFRGLFAAAGLHLKNVVQTGAGVSLLEGTKRA